MANRKNTPSTIEEKIERTKKDIDVAELGLKSLKDKLKKLNTQKKQKDMQTLYTLVLDSGKTINDVQAWINGR